MKKTLGFVNVKGGAFHDITSTVLALDYNITISAAA
jgi:hypothetical protein